jgi:REP element-mobilizing transposase RayT
VIMTEIGWNRDAPPGFKGLQPDLPVTIYERHLPHWRQDGATYFVTYRLADSLPQSKLRFLASLKQDWEAQHPPPRSDADREQFVRLFQQKVEDWLDQGMGSCCLSHSEAADIVFDSWQHFDGERYELDCLVVMPNHVHLIVRPLEPKTDPLEAILQSRKGRSARLINALFKQSGTRWEEESFDRIIRDEEHLYRCIQYIGSNPARAGLAAEACRLWIRPEWKALGWAFET